MKKANKMIERLRYICLLFVIVFGLMAIIGSNGGGGSEGGDGGGNNAPVANAGPDQNVATDSVVTLYGYVSSDDDGDTLTYYWSFSSLPAGSNATLSDSAEVNPTFTADVDGSYVVSLMVNDGTVNSQPDTATITASTGTDNVLLLDGIDDWAIAATSIFPDTSTAESFTVEAWIYPTDSGSYIAEDDAYDLILYYNTDASNNGVGIRFTIYYTCSSSRVLTEYRDITLNQWNHVAGIFDASTQQMKISINGILSSSPAEITAGTFCSDDTSRFMVGYDYEGKMDELMVSNSARYNSNFTPSDHFTPDANTKGLWHFNELAGSTSFIDSSGNGNTLTGLNGAQTN